MDSRLNDDLHNLVKMCLSRERIDVFVEAIDNDRRNAITHDDYLVDPIEETIELVVGGEDEILSYSAVRDFAVEARCAAQSHFVFSVLAEYEGNVQELNELRDEMNEET